MTVKNVLTIWSIVNHCKIVFSLDEIIRISEILIRFFKILVRKN
jgi:hypothetical protein